MHVPTRDAGEDCATPLSYFFYGNVQLPPSGSGCPDD
jgi:hypothetical protein